MNLFESFKLAFDAIRANKMRSILTTLGIVIGVSAVILLVSVGQGLKSSVTETFSSLGSNLLYVMPFDPTSSGQPNMTFKLNLDHMKDIEREAVYYKEISADLETRGTIKFGSESRDSMVVGVTENFLPMLNYEIDEGSNFSAPQVTAYKRVAIIGKTITDELYNGRDPIGSRLNIEGQKFTVIGTFKPKGKAMGQDQDDTAYIPITTAQRVYGMDRVTLIAVQAKDEESVDLAAAEIKGILKKRLDEKDFSVNTQDQMLDAINQILGIITVALGGIAGISLVVGGIGIMNIMLVSVTERTREIGIRKAVGAKTYNILTQFVIEAATLSVVGGAIGISIGLLGSLALSSVLPSEVTPWSIALAFIFSAAIGIFFGAYPALKASRLSPIEALRHE
jgi:putative ABC transport system permease protein